MRESTHWPTEKWFLLASRQGREEQLIIHPLGTGHSRLWYHLVSKLKICPTHMWHWYDDRRVYSAGMPDL